MRQLGSVLFALILLLTGLTACADTQETAAAGMSQSARQRSGESMLQGERPTGTRGTNTNRTEGAQIRVRDSGSPTAETRNNSAGIGGAEKVVTGKVKSIVGNEVVLIVVQNTNTAGQRQNREGTDNTAAVSSQEQSSAVQSSKHTAQAQAADEESSSESAAQEITEICLIPVGMAVGNKDFSAIKAGNTLRIYFGTDPGDGSEIITAVELR